MCIRDRTKTDLFLYALEETVFLKLFSMSRNISPDYICFVRLKIPWCNKNQIVFSDPHTSFYLSSNSTCSDFTICTFHNNVISSNYFYNSTKQFALLRHY